MANSLYYKIGPNVHIDNLRIVELFFMDYIDRLCNNDVQYTLEKIWEPNMVHQHAILRLDFGSDTDMLALYLLGIPKELQPYMYIA